jgi:hypothetical protein
LWRKTCGSGTGQETLAVGLGAVTGGGGDRGEGEEGAEDDEEEA